MSRFADLLRALGARADLGVWTARARTAIGVEVSVDGAAPRAALTRSTSRLELHARVHVDGVAGRGSADLQLADSDPIEPSIDEAVTRASASIGAAWRAPPPGAPARVELTDRAQADPERVAADAIAALIAAAGIAGVDLVTARARVEVAAVALTTSRGLAARWSETTIVTQALVAIDGTCATLVDRARASSRLQPAARIASAMRRARAARDAVPTPTGRAAILLSAELLGGDGAPLLGALAALADASLHRQGLARARQGHAIVAGADAAAQPLTLRSDGTRALGLASTPLGEQGEPVRRFTIVEAGILVGLALDQREAALRGIPPNGGVRNLVVSGGASSAEELRDAGVLELLELSHVDIEPFTGHGSLGIGLALRHGDGGPLVVRGGEVQGDLIAALAHSRRTRDAIVDGAYVGPELIWLPDLAIV